MKRSLLIGMLAFSVACGRGSSPGDTAQADIQARSGTTARADAEALAPGMPGDVEQRVTLIGCLTGPPMTGTAGTTGSALGAGDTVERYQLVDATPDVDSAGVGENGAGGSGGPLVSGKATYELDGVPNGARGDVNKKVRLTALIEARPAGTTDTAGTGTAATGTAGTRSSSAGPGRSVATPPYSNRRLDVQGVEVLAEQCDK